MCHYVDTLQMVTVGKETFVCFPTQIADKISLFAEMGQDVRIKQGDFVGFPIQAKKRWIEIRESS